MIFALGRISPYLRCLQSYRTCWRENPPITVRYTYLYIFSYHICRHVPLDHHMKSKMRKRHRMANRTFPIPADVSAWGGNELSLPPICLAGFTHLPRCRKQADSAATDVSTLTCNCLRYTVLRRAKRKRYRLVPQKAAAKTAGCDGAFRGDWRMLLATSP